MSCIYYFGKMYTKRKHIVIEIEKKIEAVRRVERDESASFTADLCVGLSTVSDRNKMKSKFKTASFKTGPKEKNNETR